MIESGLLTAPLLFFLSVTSFRVALGMLGLRLKPLQSWGLACLMTAATMLATWGVAYLLDLI